MTANGRVKELDRADATMDPFLYRSVLLFLGLFEQIGTGPYEMGYGFMKANRIPSNPTSWIWADIGIKMNTTMICAHSR